MPRPSSKVRRNPPIATAEATKTIASRRDKQNRDVSRLIHDLANDVMALSIRARTISGDATCVWSQPDAVQHLSRLSELVLDLVLELQQALSTPPPKTRESRRAGEQSRSA